MTATRLVMASKVKKVMPKGGELVVENPKRDDVQYPCLVRAVYKKHKISTIVQYYFILEKKTLCTNIHANFFYNPGLT